MESGGSSYETAINIPESKHGNGKGKTIVGAPATFTATTKATPSPEGGWKKGAAIFDFVLRLASVAAALGAAGVMGTTEQTLPFFTQFFQFKAEYDDFQVFKFFVVANAITGAYLVLSLPFSIVCIVRPDAAGPRLLLLICDMVMMALTIAAAAAAASVVYLIHNGSSDANWLPICQQFGDYCQSTSEAVVASFVASALFMFLIVLSISSIRRN